MNLLALSHLVEEPAWAARIDRTFRLFATRLEQFGRAVPMMAAALSAHVDGPQQIVIVGDRSADPLARAVASKYLPFATIIAVRSEVERQALAAATAVVRGMPPVDGTAAVYVCSQFTCRPPVTRVEELERHLGRA